MVNGGTMILKLNVCMSKNDGCVLIMVHNRYFFANGRKDKSICFKAEYFITDSGNCKFRLI